MRTIPQRELRNNISKVLREVEAGERLRITVDGRPVADLVPIEGQRRRFVPREVLLKMIREAPLDPGFQADIDSVFEETTDDI